ncbi:MAG: hypothetical protein E7652_06520 [Ruminococcaceae bacterium]|nr:hypothetical protein [Oscillospiraceae bacterium]
MKKLFAILMAALMLATFASCGEKKDETKADDTTVAETEAKETDEKADPEIEKDEVGSALEAFETAWAAHGDDEKFFVWGGSAAENVMDAPGAIAADDVDTLGMLYFPEAYAGKIDDAATLFHGMLTNNFSGAVLHFTDAADVEGFITDMEASLKSAQWMCGFPEKMSIATINDDYVVVMFGLGDVVDNFDSKFADSYSTYNVVVNGIVVE